MHHPPAISPGAPTILWLHSHFLQWTGGHQYVFEVIKRLQNSYHVVLMAGAASDSARRRFAEIGVELCALNSRSTNSAPFWLTLPLQLRLAADRVRRSTPANTRATISSMFPMNALAGALPWPHFQVCWEPYALFWDEAYLRDFKPAERAFSRAMRVLYGSLDIRATRRANAVLTLSEFNRCWIGQVYGRNDARLVYEGVDSEFFRPTHVPELESKYQHQKVILHSTDFTAIKGTEYLIRALPLVRQSVPDLKVLVTHTLANPHRRQQMEVLARELLVLDCVEFLGRVDYALLPAYYTLADVVAQPSINQSMSLSVKEAMACGTPIVTSLEGCEQTPDGDAGYLVDPKDSHALAGALTRILADESLAAQMGARGREIITARFSWEAVAARFEQAIEDLP